MTTHRKDAPLHFMGEDFASVTALRGKYPAFAGDDAVRAIFAGCDTPAAVEVFCAARLAKARAASTAAARRSQYGAMRALGPIKTDKLAAAKRGGLATAAKGRAK